MRQGSNQIDRIDSGRSLKSDRSSEVGGSKVISQRRNFFSEVKSGHILRVHEQGQLRFKLGVRTQEAKSDLLRLCQTKLLLEVLLDEE